MSYRITRHKYLTATEVAHLQRICGTDRDGTLITLALSTGGRATELLNLTTNDLSVEDGTHYCFIRGIKGSDDRNLPIKPALYQSLIANAVGSKLFPISYRRLAQVWGMYKPGQKSFHSLRHTFAVSLYERTKDIKLVQVALGHRSISNTLVYAHLVDTVDKLKRAML